QVLKPNPTRVLGGRQSFDPDPIYHTVFISLIQQVTGNNKLVAEESFAVDGKETRNGQIFQQRLQRRSRSSTLGSRSFRQRLDRLGCVLRLVPFPSLHVATHQSTQVPFLLLLSILRITQSEVKVTILKYSNGVWHDKAMLYEHYHWKKAMAKKKPYNFKWNQMDKEVRESYYLNWPVYFP
ncbi:hypothetical protein V2J09_010611, partial [Rumex salicifolius]